MISRKAVDEACVWIWLSGATAPIVAGLLSRDGDRLVFSIVCGNTDDQARNHAVFWDGHTLQLTPAYDICPQSRAGNEATQAMLILGENRMSNLAFRLLAAPKSLLDQTAAVGIVAHHIETLRSRWASVCDEAALSEVDRKRLRGRMFLNLFIFEGAPDTMSRLA